jgi:hypothetical protein
MVMSFHSVLIGVLVLNPGSDVKVSKLFHTFCRFIVLKLLRWAVMDLNSERWMDLQPYSKRV